MRINKSINITIVAALSLFVPSTHSFQSSARISHKIPSIPSILLSPITSQTVSRTRVMQIVSSTPSSLSSATTNDATNGEGKTTPIPTKLPTSTNFANFDYESCWYPVVWARDLKLNKPTKVTVFDTDYVIAKIPNKTLTNKEKKDLKKLDMNDPKNVMIVAMKDVCPHKSAALSEGRVTSSGYFQCAYHGWSFDALNNGKCIEIPQIYTELDETTSSSSSSAYISSRTCGTAIPACVVQNMVWLFPFGSAEEALQAPPPPEIDEINNGFRMTTVIRDLPIDFTLLLENIMDPDHGLFAHNVKGKGFDLYTASKVYPQIVEIQEDYGGKAVTMRSRVEAVEKLLAMPSKNVKAEEQEKKEQEKEQISTPAPLATSKYQLPCVVEQCRRDKVTGETKFVIGFWITPTGVGRSRFMSANIYNLQFSLPRWLTILNLNAFLDQDTFLLATQQAKVLPREAEMLKELKEREQSNGVSTSDEEVVERLKKKPLSLRKNTFVYRSPTEKMNMNIGKFWDKTILRAPQRINKILEMDKNGQLSHLPPRSSVLDIETQHLQICPDSQHFVKRCERLQYISKVIFTVTVLAKALSLTSVPSKLFSPESRMAPIVRFVMTKWLSSSFVMPILSVSALTAWVSKWLRGFYFFRYTESHRDQDLEKIPMLWKDP